MTSSSGTPTFPPNILFSPFAQTVRGIGTWVPPAGCAFTHKCRSRLGAANSVWPAWMLEGLAVYMETNFTTAGRGRSTYYETMARGAVEAGVLNSSEYMTLDMINGTNPYFPMAIPVMSSGII